MAPVSEPWASGLFQLRRPSGGVDCTAGYATLTRDALGSPAEHDDDEVFAAMVDVIWPTWQVEQVEDPILDRLRAGKLNTCRSAGHWAFR